LIFIKVKKISSSLKNRLGNFIKFVRKKNHSMACTGVVVLYPPVFIETRLEKVKKVL